MKTTRGLMILTKQEIEKRLTELKSDYARIQGDLEKMEAVTGNSASGEHALIEIEQEMSKLRKQLDEMQS
jgi:predicted nuclease with TOPRIM domain